MKNLKMKLKQQKKKIELFINAIYAGIMIGIGGTVYLSVANKMLGAFLFGIGLQAILLFDLPLFTGRVGFIKSKEDLINLIPIQIGNFLGTLFVALALQQTKNQYLTDCKYAVLSSITETPQSTYVLSFFCGLLMFIAVSIWKRFLACDIKILGVFLCVGVFILCGFEHCIANMFYINLSGMLNQDTALWLGRITAGNMLGGLIVPAIGKVLKEISAD